ncbi:Asp23/Gls24 family envelope stress response protein [Streptomyces mirabilis]|uniref:Asp23/Gls24 family envelope stress response protein n=1 Tax=Streptomyces mirabilis TaxID=68239 RepID=UPI0036A04597
MLQAARPGPQEPPGTRGRTAIADGIVEKIAGTAAQEVPGLNAPGGRFTRTMGAVPDRVPGGRPSAGREVKVEVGEKQTATDPQVVVEYGVSITEVQRRQRRAPVARRAGVRTPPHRSSMT